MHSFSHFFSQFIYSLNPRFLPRLITLFPRILYITKKVCFMVSYRCYVLVFPIHTICQTFEWMRWWKWRAVKMEYYQPILHKQHNCKPPFSGTYPLSMNNDQFFRQNGNGYHEPEKRNKNVLLFSESNIPEGDPSIGRKGPNSRTYPPIRASLKFWSLRDGMVILENTRTYKRGAFPYSFFHLFLSYSFPLDILTLSLFLDTRQTLLNTPSSLLLLSTYPIYPDISVHTHHEVTSSACGSSTRSLYCRCRSSARCRILRQGNHRHPWVQFLPFGSSWSSSALTSILIRDEQRVIEKVAPISW